MSDHVDTVADLESGQSVRVETDTGTTVDAHVTESEHAPESLLRVELAVDADDADYRLEATRGDGEWTPVALRRADHGSTVWSTMGEVVSVEALGESERDADESVDVE